MQAEVSFDGRCAVAAFDPRRLMVDQLIQAIEANSSLGARRCWAELFLQLPYQAALERAGRAKPGAGIISLN